MTDQLHLRVSLATQTLELCEGNQVLRSYQVSTSRHGPGSEEGSHRTPLGPHRICEKHGEDAPEGTMFRSRKPVGVWSSEPVEEDLVLTRILRLEGLSAENSNSYQRYIYIHGTNHEDTLGTPCSCGCIRMSNHDVIALFEQVPVGTPVLINED